MTAHEFTDAVALYCHVLDASVTSWIRTQRRNDHLNGVLHSPHLVGLGADVIYDFATPLDERQSWAERLGLQLVPEHDHDHLQPKGWKAG